MATLMSDDNQATRGRRRVYTSILDAIGHTPLVYLPKLSRERGCKAELYGKLEFFNPMGSVKDRIGKAMIEAAEAQGTLKEGTVVIEPTSGNTGIALAFICAAKGYRLILCMPESMSLERRKMLLILGAEIELTPAAEGMKGALKRAAKLHAEITPSLILQQFDKPRQKKSGPIQAATSMPSSRASAPAEP
jgi:cysteine synthase A